MKIKHLAAFAFTLALPSIGLAQVSGFGGFAPFNAYQNSAPSTNPNIGYSTDGSTFNMTDQNQSEQTSGYYATPQDVTSFTASFTYTSIPGTNFGSPLAANGIAFNFQNDPTGTAAVGGVGNANGLGIGGISSSASVAYNNFGGYYAYQGSTVFQTGGNVPDPYDGSWQSISPVNLSSGDPMAVNLVYSNGTVRQTITDTVTGDTFKNAFVGVDIVTAVGAKTAYVGFSGSTGGYVSTQSVSNFTYKGGTGVAYSAVSSSAVFSPIAVTGFNRTVVVPAAIGSATNAAAYVNATPDNGTNLSVASTGYTFYETGLAGSPSGTGLPASGSTFVSAVDSQHTFTMPQYDSNGDGTSDSLVLSASLTAGNLNFTTPAAYSALSFLVSAGHGPVPIAVTVNYANGTSVDVGDIVAKDWFYNTPYAYSAGGRYDIANDAFQQSTGNVNLYQYDLALPASTSLISSLSFLYDGSPTGSGVGIIFAVSGAAPAGPFIGDIPGDLNGDGTVDFSDLGILLSNYGSTGLSVPSDYALGDINGDGSVDFSDLGILLSNYGSVYTPPGVGPSFRGGAVPEPANMSFVAIGAMALAGRRSRR